LGITKDKKIRRIKTLNTNFLEIRKLNKITEETIKMIRRGVYRKGNMAAKKDIISMEVFFDFDIILSKKTIVA
jgi:hypothetical protein